MKSFSFLLSQFVNFIDFIFRISFLRNRRYFYRIYYGSDHKFVLLIKNIIRPKRFLKKFSYGQIVPLPSILSLGTPIKGQKLIPEEWKTYLDTMKRDGIVLIPGFFKAHSLTLNNRYRTNPTEYPPSDKYNRFSVDLNDPEVFKIATDPTLLGFLASYYGSQPFLRHTPGINCTHPNSEKAREFIGYNNLWHYDTANQLTAHVLLSDVAPTDSCMFFAKKSHLKHRVQMGQDDYYYSEEYVRDHFEVVSCAGELGTLVIFDPNGLHRVDLKPGTFRAHLHLNFVPGNDILKLESNIPLRFESRPMAEMAALSELQKNSLVYV